VNIGELDRRAMAVTAQLIAGVTAQRWEDPTPCARWRVADLLAHVLGQYHGFALAASGQPTSIEAFAPRPTTPRELPARYARAAELVTGAFDEDGVLERRFYLPEIRDGASFPATAAIGFHLVDEVVHAWDLARAIGMPVDFDTEVLRVALSVARQVPDDPASRGDGAAFGPGSDPGPDRPALDRIVALLGRDPDWAATR
jgi:uncharacterized protein (TIGR03086 family)